eukprot:746663-Hanusia_phi.AAC.3
MREIQRRVLDNVSHILRGVAPGKTVLLSTPISPPRSASAGEKSFASVRAVLQHAAVHVTWPGRLLLTLSTHKRWRCRRAENWKQLYDGLLTDKVRGRGLPHDDDSDDECVPVDGVVVVVVQ